MGPSKCPLGVITNLPEIGTKSKMISKRIKDLIQKAQETMIDYSDERKELQTEKMLDNFFEWAESEASRLELPLDYFLSEFT